MTTEHPITPPPELVREWMERTQYDEHTWFYESYIAEQATRWGADQELEACVEWMKTHLHSGPNLSKQLRTARRPKPPSLKEQAIAALQVFGPGGDLTPDEVDTIRRALESLPD